MKLNNLVMRGGVLVILLSLLVVGCKQNEELSVEEHRKGENAYQHVWEAEYNGDNYYRSALQFGSGKMDVEYAKVRVKMNYPGNGKAGLLFATNEREIETTVGGGEKEKKKVYDFYAFAFGRDPAESNTLEAYVDYYIGLEKFNDSSSTSEKFGTGKQTEVVEASNLTGITWNGASPVTVDMIVEKETTTGGSGSETVTYNLKIQDTSGNVLWSQDDVAATGDGVVNEGYLCSYGMVSKLAANPKNVDTTWTLDRDSFEKTGAGAILAAEDAE